MGDDNFEQGFNDSELEEIMEEIESLEDDSTEAANAPEETAQSEEPEVESSEPVEEPSNVVALNNDSAPHAGAPASTSMDFSVNGEMSLNMCFHVSGQKIDLTIDAQNGFVIMLPGGAKFNVPLSHINLKSSDKAS